MTQIPDEEHLTENNPAINTNSNELSRKPFRITMELPLFLIMLGITLSGTPISNIIFYRTCVHSLHHSKTECSVFLSLDKNNETQKLEEEVQKYSTFISTVRSIIESVAPAVLSLFLGVWSDTHGRKPLIVWPLFGLSISAILMVIYSMLEDLGPWWYILTVIPFSLSGGVAVLFTGAYCYLNDITSSDKKSFRMTMLEAAISLGMVVGLVLSSYVLRAVGNVYLVLISATLNVVAYTFTNICIVESVTEAVQGSVSTVLDFRLVKEMLKECFKPRLNHKRAQILFLTLANSLWIFILYGLMSLDYLYAREKIHWAITDYTLFSALHTTINFCGAFLGVTVLQSFLRISDLAFIIIANVSSILEYVITALAVTTWHMYLGAAISTFRGLSSPLIRSLLTKSLPVEDIAKVFALMSAIEGLCPLIAPPLFNSLYEVTISSFPAAIYVLSAGVTGVSLVSICLVQYYRRNEGSAYQPLILDADT